jgi:hypothetical protein
MSKMVAIPPSEAKNISPTLGAAMAWTAPQYRNRTALLTVAAGALH